MTVYILYSEKLKKYYVGITADLQDRLYRHNNGESLATKAGTPWILVWSIEVPDRSTAMKLERKIKGRGIQRFLNEVKK